MAVQAIAAIAWTGSGCTLVNVGAGHGPARVESNGLIEGHAAVGIRDEDRFLRVRLLDGESDGALGEVVLWKLFRLEVGALGVGLGVGPFDLALGTIFYEPELPEFQGDEPAPEAATAEASCDLCREEPE